MSSTSNLGKAYTVVTLLDNTLLLLTEATADFAARVSNAKHINTLIAVRPDLQSDSVGLWINPDHIVTIRASGGGPAPGEAS